MSDGSGPPFSHRGAEARWPAPGLARGLALLQSMGPAFRGSVGSSLCCTPRAPCWKLVQSGVSARRGLRLSRRRRREGGGREAGGRREGGQGEPSSQKQEDQGSPSCRQSTDSFQAGAGGRAADGGTEGLVCHPLPSFEATQLRLGLELTVFKLRITRLVSGLNETPALHVSPQREFNERPGDE